MTKQKIHFVGIGGIGMSALARYFKAKGWIVSGSDSMRSPITDALKREGVKITIGHSPTAISRDIGLVVYNRAILHKNPELEAARRLNVLTLPYAKVLGGLTDEYITIAITGSHGKSTTTGLAALTLIKAGLEPTVLIGTNLREFGNKNIRLGKSHFLVLEADDYGAAFLDYSPAYSIVTNIDREHLDHYKTFGALKNAFVQFLARTQPGGTLILNKDDANLFSLREKITELAKNKKLKVVWYSSTDRSTKSIKTILNIPGKHNVSNANAVYQLGKVLGMSEKQILKGLALYNGAWRRMEYKGELKGALVFDDYAHHPTEIQATLQAFKEKYPTKKIVCVFQPHQAKRLKLLFKQFVTAFGDADEVVLLPLYAVAGRDEKAGRFDSEHLARALAKRSPKKFLAYLAEPKKLKKVLMKLPGPLSNKIIVMMGAGDIVNYTNHLCEL